MKNILIHILILFFTISCKEKNVSNEIDILQEQRDTLIVENIQDEIRDIGI